jgi:LmbE family N-acetylglucosaminyl deacetylase
MRPTLIIYVPGGGLVSLKSSYILLIEPVVHLDFDMNTVSAPLRVLAFFAHPDDETMFLGGTLAYLSANGVQLYFLSATRGEGGEMGDPPICQRSELGSTREEEMECAIKALGGTSLSFLGFKDPEVGPEGELYPFSEELEPVIRKLVKVLKEIQPDVILTHGPGGEYGHPAHIQAHQAMMIALDDLDFSPQAVYSPAWLSRDTGEFTPAPGILVDTSPWIDRKIAAVTCHRSQHGLFLRHGAARAGRPVTIPEMVRSQEALCKILPVGSEEEDPLLTLLELIRHPLDD